MTILGLSTNSIINKLNVLIHPTKKPYKLISDSVSKLKLYHHLFIVLPLIELDKLTELRNRETFSHVS